MIFAKYSVRVGAGAFGLVGIMLMMLVPDLDAQKMDNRSLERILKSVTDSLDGEAGMWQLRYSDRLMFVITDEIHDRMRIISPVRTMEEVTLDEMEQAMSANFHSALDVRYAISEEIMWVAFIHPLGALSEAQVRDGLLQVFRAAETFGTTFSSSELIFPGRRENQGSGRNGGKKM